MADALAGVRVWVPAWLGKLQLELRQRETAAVHGREKQALLQAGKSLFSHRELIGSRFFDELASALGRRESPGDFSPTEPARLHATPGLEDLALVDERSVQETVNLSRIQQLVKMACDDELSAFSARLSHAQGLDVVRVAANPLRPEAIVGALVRALATLHVDESVRAHWLQAGAAPLGQELRGFYQTLCDRLEAMGVPQAGFAVIQAPESRGLPPAAAASGRPDSVPASALQGSEPRLTLDHLHQLLAGNLAHNRGVVSDQGASGSGNAMVRTLAAEVVTQMMRNVAEEPLLQPAVRQIMQGLKAPLLQVARTTPHFFADAQNPARRLLDAITARGLAFRSEHDDGFQPFARRVLDTVKELQTSGAALPARLADMAQRLDEPFAPAVAAPSTASAGRALPTADAVQKPPSHLVAKVAEELQALRDFARTPGVVRRFVTGPWAQVVAHARMIGDDSQEATVGETAAMRYLAMVPDLLWSAQLVQSSRNRPRLIKVAPQVLRVLREGLDTIDFPRPQSEAFFQALMGLHDAAYKTQHAGFPALLDGNGDSVEAAASSELPMATPDPAWVPELDAKDPSLPAADYFETEPAYLESDPPASDWSPLDRVTPLVQPGGLNVGIWVELQQGDERLRCQLTWASPQGIVYRFITERGRAISMTRRSLDRLIERGSLHLLPEDGVDAAPLMAHVAMQTSHQDLADSLMRA